VILAEISPSSVFFDNRGDSFQRTPPLFLLSSQ
jgi:hypothetical protein